MKTDTFVGIGKTKENLSCLKTGIKSKTSDKLMGHHNNIILR